MKIWAAILRGTGTLLLIMTIADFATAPTTYPLFNSLSNFVRILSPTVSHLAIAMFCFGGASALMTLQRIDLRLMRRRVQPIEAPESLAPDAPTWGKLPEPLHRPSPVTESVDAFEQRMARTPRRIRG